jgi:hypothetical protein
MSKKKRRKELFVIVIWFDSVDEHIENVRKVMEAL